MHWKICSLDSGLREKLVQITLDRGLSLVQPHFFRSQDRPGKVLACLAVGAMVSGLSGFTLWSLLGRDPAPLAPAAGVGIFFVLAATWGVVSAVEILRIRASKIRPFLLVTPRVLLRSDYGFAGLEGYRLNEATAFESAETYGGSKQTYQGRRYTFRFPEGNVMFTLSAASEIAALDGVLAQARAGGGAPDAALPLLPEGGGAKNPPGGRAFTDPLGAFWLAVAGILLLIFFACLVLGRLARSFAA